MQKKITYVAVANYLTPSFGELRTTSGTDKKDELSPEERTVRAELGPEWEAPPSGFSDANRFYPATPVINFDFDS